MRNALNKCIRRVSPVLFCIVCLVQARAGEQGARVFLPDLLPANTILCTVPPDQSTLEHDYSQSIFARISNMPEMGPFLRSFEESRRKFAQDISNTAGVDQQLAMELVQGRLGLGLLDVRIGRDGNPVAEFVIAISLKSQPDRKTIFSAVMALLNRPEVVRAVLESQGIDPNLPLRSLAQEETVAGAPPILRIGPNIRIASIGNLVLLYHGPGADGIKKIFEAMANPASSLSRSASFQAAYRGADAKPGTSFCYFNMPRVNSILDAVNLSQVSRVTDALGLGAVQSIGVSGAYHQDGVRHSLYLHVPGGNFTGLMSALIPMPQGSPVGVEGYGQIIPSPADAFMAARVDVPILLREIPYVLDSLGAVTRPGGVGGMVQNERVLGVPLTEVLQNVGSDIILRPHDDTQVLIFQNVNIASFENMVARMEQNAGVRFSQQNIQGYVVRYYNRRSNIAVPLAPAFCLVPRQPGSPTGIVYMASHPQAVVSLIQESITAREPLSNTPDFLKATSGMAGNYSLYYYNGNRECYRRVYNFLLPVMSLWSSSTRYPVDTGLLPTASSIMPAFFGSAMGVRCLPEGMQIHAYSPIGFGAVVVQTLDKLVVSNPLVIGYAYAVLETWMQTMPTTW